MLARSTAPDASAALAGALDDADPTVRAAAAGGLLADKSSLAPDVAEAAEATLRALINGGPAERMAAARTMARLGRRMSPIDSSRLPGRPLARGPGRDDARDRRDGARRRGGPRHGPPRSGGPRSAGGGAFTIRPTEAAADRRRCPHRSRRRRPTRRRQRWSRWRATAARSNRPSSPGPRRRSAGRWRSQECEHTLREHARPGAGRPAADVEARDRFLCDVLARRRERDQDLLLGAMSVLGAPSARGVIRRCLRSGDVEVRAQAIEALDSLGDHRLGRALTRLVEHQPRKRTGIATRLCGCWAMMAIRGSPALPGRSRTEETPCATLRPELEHLETMLQLRRVPLFERLEPEDLLRVAMIASERTFEAGSTLIREGEVGDEMFVLLEGTVHVTRREPTAASGASVTTAPATTSASSRSFVRAPCRDGDRRRRGGQDAGHRRRGPAVDPARAAGGGDGDAGDAGRAGQRPVTSR